MTWDVFRPPAAAFALVLYIFIQGRNGFGPVAVGICHFLNVLLGTSTSLFYIPDYPQTYYFIALIVAIYIAGVTWFGRVETSQTPRWHFCRAAGVMLSAAVLALVLPEVRRALSHGIFARLEPQGIPTDGWEVVVYRCLLLLWSVIYAIPVFRAFREPSQERAQAVARTGLHGLISLDALLAFGVIGWPGLLILILLISALLLRPSEAST